MRPMGELPPLARAIDSRRRPRLKQVTLAGLALLTVLLIAGVVVGLSQLRSERGSRRSDVAKLTKRLGSAQQALTLAQAQNATLAKRLHALEAKFAQSNPNLGALAKRVLRSVYTVESSQELGTAWVAWRNSTGSYLITANHVVADAIASGDNQVTLRQPGRAHRDPARRAACNEGERPARLEHPPRRRACTRGAAAGGG